MSTIYAFKYILFEYPLPAEELNKIRLQNIGLSSFRVDPRGFLVLVREAMYRGYEYVVFHRHMSSVLKTLVFEITGEALSENFEVIDNYVSEVSLRINTIQPHDIGYFLVNNLCGKRKILRIVKTIKGEFIVKYKY